VGSSTRRINGIAPFFSPSPWADSEEIEEGELQMLLHNISELLPQVGILMFHLVILDSHFFMLDSYLLIIIHKSLKLLLQIHASTHVFDGLQTGFFVAVLCLDKEFVWAEALGQGESDVKPKD